MFNASLTYSRQRDQSRILRDRVGYSSKSFDYYFWRTNFRQSYIENDDEKARIFFQQQGTLSQ